jgi:hypothetical protein
MGLPDDLFLVVLEDTYLVEHGHVTAMAHACGLQS